MTKVMRMTKQAVRLGSVCVIESWILAGEREGPVAMRAGPEMQMARGQRVEVDTAGQHPLNLFDPLELQRGLARSCSRRCGTLAAEAYRLSRAHAAAMKPTDITWCAG